MWVSPLSHGSGLVTEAHRPGVVLSFDWRLTMTWETPAATNLRFGFEITMYIATR